MVDIDFWESDMECKGIGDSEAARVGGGGGRGGKGKVEKWRI